MTSIRVAGPDDVAPINELRLAVRENILSDPSWLTAERKLQAITIAGRGWVFESDGDIVGFSIARLQDHAIEALFVRRGHEKRGIGRALLARAVDWLFEQGAASIWLSTDPGTRAEAFYRKQGWRFDGPADKGEVRFVLPRPADAP
jgi:GNAT superfamily N-acetyltransferase